MISFIRPNLFGNSENQFQRDFIDPIQIGMASDATDAKKTSADDCLTRFVNTVEPYIQRRDASLLRKDLPSLQQVCFHVPPTKIQRAFYRAFRGHQERTNEKNFLKHYAALRTIHNHPGTLLLRDENTKDKQKQDSTIVDQSEEKYSKFPAIKIETIESEFPAIKTEPIEFEFADKFNSTQEPQHADAIIEILSSDEEEDDSDEMCDSNNEWWTKPAKKIGAEKMKHVERYVRRNDLTQHFLNFAVILKIGFLLKFDDAVFFSGNKCIILLHMLVHASILGEKTVVFSQSLKVCMGR